MTTLKNLAFYKIDFSDTFIVDPIDSFQNLFRQITIDVDASVGDVTIQLPEIYTTYNGNFNSTIIINRVDASGNALKISVDPASADLIGSVNTIQLATQFDSAVIKPVSLQGWSAQVTSSNIPSVLIGLSGALLSDPVYVDYAVGSIIICSDYNTSGFGCTIVKTSLAGSDNTDWVVMSTDDVISTGGTGQTPIL